MKRLHKHLYLVIGIFLLICCNGEGENSSTEPVTLTYSTTSFTEDRSTLTGVMNETITVTLTEETFSTIGTLTENTHYTTSNIPSGGTLTITVTDTQTAEITFSGLASNDTDDDTSSMNVAFTADAFTGSTLPANGSESENFSVAFTNALVLFNAGTTNGNMGGFAGASATCSAELSSLGLPHTNVTPFLSFSSSDEIRDMPANFSIPTTFRVESANSTKIADNWTDLLDGSIDTSLSSAGVLPSSTYWWTGSRSAGDVNPIDTCSSWSTNGPLTGTTGSSGSTSTQWIFFNLSEDCFFSSLYLLCLAYD